MDPIAGRYLSPLFVSAGITFGQFWLMTCLIHVEEESTSATPRTVVEIVEVMHAPLPEPTRRKPPIRKPVAEAPEPSKLDLREIVPSQVGIPLFPNEPSDRNSRGETRPRLMEADGDASPLLRVRPDYPPLAMRRGLEGRVLVEFTIAEDGSVRDARVIASEPGRIFDAAALKAVGQWRYAPKIVDGKAVEQRDQRISIPFRLDGERG